MHFARHCEEPTRQSDEVLDMRRSNLPLRNVSIAGDCFVAYHFLELIIHYAPRNDVDEIEVISSFYLPNPILYPKLMKG
jgi:hypothetical protein